MAGDGPLVALADRGASVEGDERPSADRPTTDTAFRCGR